jgi:hypothetical protein
MFEVFIFPKSVRSRAAAMMLGNHK